MFWNKKRQNEQPQSAHQPPKITLPDMKEISFEPKVLRIRIHDSEKLSAEDFGRVAAVYVRANHLKGHPVFGKSHKTGIFEFVLTPTEDEFAKIDEERKANEAEFDRRVLELVKVEMVMPK